MKSRSRNICIFKFSLPHSHDKRAGISKKKLLLSTHPIFLCLTWFTPLWKISRSHIIMVPDKTPQIFKNYILEKNPATKVLGIYFNNHLKKEFNLMYNIIIRYVCIIFVIQNFLYITEATLKKLFLNVLIFIELSNWDAINQGKIVTKHPYHNACEIKWNYFIKY